MSAQLTRALAPLLVLLTIATGYALPARAEPDPSPPGTHAFVFASFNVWGIPGVSKLWDERRKRLPAALRALNIDVFCLQELWIPSQQRELAAALKASHPHVVHAAGGLMLLSRWPINSHKFTHYPRYPELSFAERMAAKGYLIAQIQSPVGMFRLVNTHLTWARGKSPPCIKQLGVLLDAIKPYAKEPLFVGGDLNIATVRDIVSLGTQYQRLLNAGLLGANPPKRDSKGHFIEPANTQDSWPRDQHTWTGWDPDHIFYRSSKRMAVTRRAFTMHFAGADAPLSDHNLVRGTFVLKAVPQAKPKLLSPTDSKAKAK